MNWGNSCEERIRQAKETGSQILDLSFMGLFDIPESILEIDRLVELDLSNNLFVRLPSLINELEHLVKLNIRNNCFSYSSGIGFDNISHKAIEYIDLSLNNLTRIPDDIFYLSNLEEVDLKGNPLMHGIPETIIDQGYTAIHQFVEEIYLSETSDKLLEAKLIFVGQGEVGKTSLMKKIIDPTQKIEEGKEDTTHGIYLRKWKKEVYFSDEELFNKLDEIIDYDQIEHNQDESDAYDEMYFWDEDGYISVPLFSSNENDDEYYNPLTDNVVINSDKTGIPAKERNFKTAQFNIWDFGGQEIYYSTHQFFLTKRSIYVFVWDARKEEDYDRFLYWFNTINVLSEKSPIIVVMNKSDIREKNIDETNLSKTFSNIINFHKTSCINGDGISQLSDSIDVAFKKLPHIGDSLPQNWIELRNDLYALKADFISYEKFLEMCKVYDISKMRANFLSNYLHDLGDILHFQSDPILMNIVILNPNWVTEAFYKLIDSRYIQNNNGKFLLDQLIYIWNIEVHPKEKHAELIKLIENFELCFNILTTKEYILPELLPVNPTYKDIFIHKFSDTKFQYRFDFMPSGLMTRFICRNFVMIKYNSFWKNGVVIQYEDSLALIVADVINKRIQININGRSREGLLGIVRKEFKEIFNSLKLNSDEDYYEMVPCNCDTCIKRDVPHYYPFSMLRTFYRKNIHKTNCPINADEVSVIELFKGFEKIRPAERILSNLLIICSQLQGLHKAQVSSKEDDRNTFIAIGLANRGFIAKDQSRWGASATGVSQGELDIKIESEPGVTYGIFEGFNLNHLDRTSIKYHLEKIFNYDPNGLENNYIVVYVESNDFIGLWEKYQKVSLEIEYKYEVIGGFEDVTINYNSIRGTNIRIGRIAFRMNDERRYIYHIFVKMSL